jgi:DNA-binding response OmpR family regulator
VLLEIGLPTLDGFEVCRRLRARPDAASLTLIAMTGWGHDEDRRKSREAGFDGHLVKPVDFEQLERVMAEREARRTPVSR